MTFGMQRIPTTLDDGTGHEVDNAHPLPVTGSSAGTQYTDGQATPANPIGPQLNFDNAGTWAHVSVANPLPVAASLSAAANQRVNTQATDIAAGSAVAGSFVDGASVALGTTTQAKATDGTITSWSVIQLLKGIFDKLLGTVTIAGAVTTSGTVTEANSAASKADLDTIVTNTNKIPASPATEGGHLAAIDTSTAASKTDLDTIVTNTNKIPASPATEGGHLATIDSHIPAQGQALAAASMPVVLPATQVTTLTPPAPITGFALEAGHLAAIDTSTAASKTDLDTIVTNTNKIPAAPATEGGNLATIAGIVSSSKAAVKSTAAGDFVDGAVVGIGTTTQTKATDATTTSWSVIQLLKGIFFSLLGTLSVQAVAGATGGSTPFHLLSGASNNATAIKGSAGTVYGYSFSNTNAAARWVKFYNKATTPAPASDAVVWAEQVPANATVIAAIPEGMNFSTGIGFATVVNASDTDNTSVGAGDLSIDIRWK